VLAIILRHEPPINETGENFAEGHGSFPTQHELSVQTSVSNSPVKRSYIDFDAQTLVNFLMKRKMPGAGRFSLAAFVLANFMVAPVISDPPRFISWQPGYFEIGILNTQDDALAGNGQKTLSIHPTDGIFNETKRQAKAQIVLAFNSAGVLNFAPSFLSFSTLGVQLSCVSPFQIHPLQTELCTFLI
jgi:hypothetical protein